MRKKQKRVLKKAFALLAIAILIFLPIGTVLAAEQSLADVNLLKDVDLKADLTNNDVKAPGDYKLDLTLTGKNVLDLELLNPQKSAIFYNADVAKKWSPAGEATVKVDMLPLSLADIPAVPTLLNTVIGTLGTLVGDLTGVVDGVVNSNGLTDGVITINGIAELNTAIAALNNLDNALVNLTDYEAQITVQKGANGEIIVNFTDGLGSHLESLIRDVVIKLLNDVIAAVDNIEVQVDLNQLDDTLFNGPVENLLAVAPILGGLTGLVGNVLDNATTITEELLDQTVNVLVDQVLNVVSTQLNTVLDLVADTTTGLLDGLLSVNVLGTTTVNVPLTVAKPSGLNGNYDIHGILANTSAVDLGLLSKNDDFATINFNEPTTPITPTLPGGEDGGIKLPKTSAGILSYGLLGLGTLLAGVGTRFYARRK